MSVVFKVEYGFDLNFIAAKANPKRMIRIETNTNKNIVTLLIVFGTIGLVTIVVFENKLVILVVVIFIILVVVKPKVLDIEVVVVGFKVVVLKQDGSIFVVVPSF